MERQQFIDNELENFVKEFPEATDSELDEILVSASKTFDAQTKPQTVTSEPQPQAEPTGMTNEIRQTLAPEVEPDLSLFQRFAGGPVGDALAGIGNIARQSQTVSPEVLAVAQQQTVIPSKEEVVATLINNAQQGAQAIRNVPTAVGGLAAMIPSFATDIARGGTDILAGGAEMLGADQLGRRIKEEGKLAADTAKQLAAESTANLRQFYEGKPTDVEGEMLAEELQPSKKQGALAKAMTTKFLWDAENMPPDAFKAKYPEALPIDTFNAKFEEVLRGQSLPQTVKSFFFDMPLESVKTIYGAIAGDPEVRQRFIERPAETIVETGVGLGIGIKGGKELYKATKDIAKKATVFEKPQTIDEAAASKMQSEREMTDFLRKNTEQRDAMRQEQAQQAEAMTGAPNKGMTAEELAATMQETPTTKPAVTIGEAERLQGEAIPEGRGGMTIGPRRPAVTFGGEGERTGEAIPEGKGMTIQPTAPSNKLDQLFKREEQESKPTVSTKEQKTMDKLFKSGNIEEKAKADVVGAKMAEELNREEITKQKYSYAKTSGLKNGYAVIHSLIKGDYPQVIADINAGRTNILDVETALNNLTKIDPLSKENNNYFLDKIKSSKTSPQPQQATEVAPKDITAQPVSETPVKPLEVIEKEIEDLKFKLNRNRNISAKQLMEAKTNISIFQDDIGDALRKNKDTSFASKQWEEIKSKYSPETLEEAEKQKFAVKEEEKMAINRKIAAEYQRKIDEQKLQPAEPTAVKMPEVEVDEFEIPKAKEAWQKTRAEIKEEMKNAIRVERLQKKQINTDSKPTAKVYKLKASKDIQATKEYYQRILDVHHKERVKEALAEGKPVPPEVLAEYPELKVEQKAEAKPNYQTMMADLQEFEQTVQSNKNFKASLKKGNTISKHMGIVDAIWAAKNHLSRGNIEKGIELYEKIKTEFGKYYSEAAPQSRPKSGPGMFGGATVQNAYEKVEPTLKKGADMLFKKGKQAYETVKRNADLTRDMGRVVDITEKEGRPVETEAPLRQGPRFIGGKPTQKGAFNPSAIIDAISSVVGGKKKERPFEVTIGDPALAKEFEKTFKATQAAETDKKQTAKAREQSTMSAYKQGLVDLFSPIIDRVPKGPEREKVMSIVHDIFYLGSPAEAFMRKTKDIVLDKVKHEDYASYMAAKAITTFREHIEKPDRIKLAEDFLKSIDPKTIKDYEKITNEWHEKAWKPILEELKASGLGDPLIINNIMGNENYAPFFPAKQLGLPHGIGENAPGAGIYKLKGGMGDYMDVLAAKMKKGIAMIAAAKINQGKLAAIDSMLQYDKNNIKEAMPEYKGFYKERDPLTGKMLEIPIVEFPEPQPGSGLALMEARRDGKKVGYYVPKEITRAFDMAMGEGDTLGATMRGFQKMTQGFRNVWIEYNPIWQVAVNAPRDIMAATIEMPKIGNKFKFMGNLAKVAPAAVGDYVPVLGKIVQAFTGYDRKKFEKDVTKALGESKLMSTREPQYLGETDTTVGEGLKRAYGLTEKHTGIAKALDTIQEFGKDIERMTKIAANLTLEGDKRFSDPEVKNIVRQIGSPAFGVRGGGDLFKTIKTATMFYNATKQSWVAAKYFLEKDPIGAVAFASVPMGLYAATIAAENGVFGDDMEKAYTLMKGYDKENKLNFPIGYKDNGEVEYISLPLPQFLKPVMRIMRTAAKENPKFLDSIIKGFSEELPMLNPVVGLINRITSYGDEKPPAAELSGQEIMTQDQWDAGGAIKGTAFLKAFWNDYLLGSQIRLKVKPNERNETWEDKAIRFVFGKVYKTNFNEDLDISATRQKQALQRLKTREAATAETPQEQQKIIQDMVKEGYTPQKNVFKNVKQRQFVENLRKTNAPAARQMEIYLSGKSKEEKIKAFQKLNDLLKKKKK